MEEEIKESASSSQSDQEHGISKSILRQFKQATRVFSESQKSLEKLSGFDRGQIQALFQAAAALKQTLCKCFDQLNAAKNITELPVDLFDAVSAAPRSAYSAIMSVLSNLKKLEWSQCLLSYANSLATSEFSEYTATRCLRVYHDLVQISESMHSLDGSRVFVVTSWTNSDAVSEYDVDSFRQTVLQKDPCFKQTEENPKPKLEVFMTKVTTQAVSRVAVRSNQHGVHDMFNETSLMLACVENNHQRVKSLMDVDHARASCITVSYISSKSLHPLAFGQDALFMALNHLNFDAAFQILKRLLEITQKKSIDFESSEHVGTRDIIRILETRHHSVRVTSFMLMLRHGQLKLLETMFELLKAAEKMERKHPLFGSVSQSNAYSAKEVLVRMLNGPGIMEDAVAHQVHVERHEECHCSGFDCHGQTAFHHAVRSQRECVVRWAVIHGANICDNPISPAPSFGTLTLIFDQQHKNSCSALSNKRQFFEQMFKNLAWIRSNKTDFENKAQLFMKQQPLHQTTSSSKSCLEEKASLQLEEIKNFLCLFHCFCCSAEHHDVSCRSVDFGSQCVSFNDLKTFCGYMLEEEDTSAEKELEDTLLEIMGCAEKLNFREFVVVFDRAHREKKKDIESGSFADARKGYQYIQKITRKILNMYKMNYLKASIGIRRSEGLGEEVLKYLREKYKDIVEFSNISLDQLRFYQCVFAIFDSDGSDTIDMDELLSTLEVYGKGHQITDFYSDKIVKSDVSGEVGLHRENCKLLVEKMLVQVKTILNATSSTGSLAPPAAAAQHALPASSQSVTSTPSSITPKRETSLNLEEFIMFMENVKYPGGKSSDLEVEFGSFCEKVLGVMLHTSEALGSIYKNLSSDIQKSFRSTAYLGKLCEEVPISNGDVLYNRGENPSSMRTGKFIVLTSRFLQVIGCGEMKMACSSSLPVTVTLKSLLTAI